MKNIDSAFRYIRMFSLVFIAGCIIISVFIAYKSYQLASQSQQKVFILANGKALEAYAADRKDNIPVEAKDHVKMFHHFFFTLDPDDKVIQSNITKALYLADASAKQQYDNLKENGYFSNLISGNISQEIQMDSIDININVYPFYFRYKGQERIIRPTTIVTRSLITEGIPYQELFGNISPLKNKSEISQRFYLFEGQAGISVDEAYRFLQNKWLEKQMQAKRKQTGDAQVEETENDSQAPTGNGLLQKKRLSKPKGAKRNKAIQN